MNNTYSEQLQNADVLVIGAGFAGATIARELAERGNKQVVLLERRSHIAGNTYDHLDEQNVLIHEYGPHIYHTNDKRVHEYLSRFTAWRDYRHEVLADIFGEYIPVPFNLNSIDASFTADHAARLKQALLETYPRGSKVGILDLKKQTNPLLRELSDYVYEKVFVHYTMKQWGLKPEEIDPAVTARVPVLVDTDNRYFQDSYQGMPLDGYTVLFQHLLDHPKINVHLNVDARELIKLSGLASTASDNERITGVDVGGKPFAGQIIFTGALDELVNWRYGILPYRSLSFTYRHYEQKHVQPCGTVNFTVSEAYTRTTEYTWLTGQDLEVTTVAEEYPHPFTDPSQQIPYYPIIAGANDQAYRRYLDLFRDLSNFYVLGRLAEYHYYNMDGIVQRALSLADDLLA